jgi:hypothetical protein
MDTSQIADDEEQKSDINLLISPSNKNQMKESSRFNARAIIKLYLDNKDVLQNGKNLPDEIYLIDILEKINLLISDKKKEFHQFLDKKNKIFLLNPTLRVTSKKKILLRTYSI